MALGDFFRINLPYGIKKNQNGEWFVFNREYMPIGWNSTEHKSSIFEDNVYDEYPIYTSYKNLDEKRLLKIAGDEKYVKRGDSGQIYLVFLYDDSSNPKNNSSAWDTYFDKIKLLASLDEK